MFTVHIERPDGSRVGLPTLARSKDDALSVARAALRASEDTLTARVVGGGLTVSRLVGNANGVRVVGKVGAATAQLAVAR